MIRSAILLIRTSMLSVLFLSASLLTLGGVLFDDQSGDGAAVDSLPSLTAIARPAMQDRSAAAALHAALFDPSRRPETVSGSVDDLKAKSATTATQAPVTLSGVLLDGSHRKAMLTLGNGGPEWSTVGSDVGGWRVASIDADGAVIERNGETVTLKVADRYGLRAKAPASADSVQPEGGPGGPPDGGMPPEPSQPGPP